VAESPHLEVVRRGFAGWNSGEVERFLETIHPEIVWQPSGVFPGLADRYEGHDGIREFWRDFTELWEMIEVRYGETRDIPPDSVLVRVHFSARGRGGIPVERDLVQRYRIRDGLLIEMHSYASWENALVATGGT
jgi:ketosteroid isomerase-like protein